MNMQEVVDIVHDAEAKGLLDNSTVDYTASPWVLKDDKYMHVVAVQEFPSGDMLAFYDGPKIILDGRKHVQTIEGIEYRLEGYEPVEYKHFPLHKFPDYINKRKIRKAIAHNGINYDLLAYKAQFGLDYFISPEGKDTWGEQEVEHIDTLVMSKTLNPDRQGGHSLDVLAKSAGGIQKKEFRYHMKREDRFKHFAADMLHYNLFDIQSNKSVYDYLLKETEGRDWSGPFTTEKCVADIIARQSHRGFAFNLALAEKNLEELDRMMEEARLKIEPLLPPRKATKAFMKDFTPPKNQFKKDGTLSSHMEKFIAKVGATLTAEREIEFQGKKYSLPLKEGVALVDMVPATLNDTTHIKEWLVSLGWSPSEYKEKDLTLKTGTKIKYTPEEYEKTALRYLEQTLNSPLKEDRCEFLECNPRTLKAKLMGVKPGRGLRVRTNPSFTVGQDKEMCPNLIKMKEKFPFAEDLVKYLTYKHRRNSILGGGADWDDEEDPEKGYLASVRDDGRIPTPADTCGAATSRMKHRVVANIPRVTSLYGEPMRGMFMADKDDCYQIGYDFASLEARIEAHYCVPMDTKALTKRGWLGYEEIKEGDFVMGYNPETKEKEWTLVKGVVKYSNAKLISTKFKSHEFISTPDHRWYTEQRGAGKNYIPKVLKTSELNTGTKIIINAPFNKNQDVTADTVPLAQGKYSTNWVQKVLSMSQAQRKSFLEGFMIADGYWHVHGKTPKWRWAQNDGDLFEAALLASYLVHDGNITVANNNGNSKVKVVNLGINNTVTGQRMVQTELEGLHEVWCLQTDLKSWVMRQKDSITITGNCYKYENLTEEGKREYCESLLLEKPNDVHSVMARRISAIINQKFERSPAKSVKYACTYGAQAEKVAKTIGSPKEVGQQVFDAFWEAAKPLGLLKEALKKHWERNDKKFIITLDGRKVPTRAAHAILNSLFQSAGVICAKTTMVLWEKKMREHGLMVDFWKDDWKNSQWAQQMIAYHDEAQIEVTKGLVKFKRFSTKEECDAFRDEQRKEHSLIWSEAHESPKGGWFVGYSLPGQLVVEAVAETSELYKLNVPLSADYVLGASWADTH